MALTQITKPVFLFHCNACRNKFLSNGYAIETPGKRPMLVAVLCPHCKTLIRAKI